MENREKHGNACCLCRELNYAALVVKKPSSEELAGQLAAALAAGETDRALELTRRLEAQLKKAGHQDKSTSGDAMAFAATPAVVPVKPERSSGASTRRTVAAALAEIGVPVQAKVITDYSEARFGERVDSRMFSALRRDERRAWGSSSPRPTYIVPALEGRYFQPIRGVLALSDWPIERRVMGPWSERADHLAATAQLARQLAWLDSRDRDVAERLAPVVARMARSIPGAIVSGVVDTARVIEAAEAELAEVAGLDDPWRSEAGLRAREQLGAEQQLWGVDVKVVKRGDD